MFHKERDGISAFPTAKTFINLLGRGYRKGWAFFIVKWTETEIIGAPFLQFHKISHYIDDIDPGSDLLYGVGCNQFMLFMLSCPQSKTRVSFWDEI